MCYSSISFEEEEEMRNNVLTSLKNTGVQEKLADIVIMYYVECRQILTVAEVGSDGVRPEGLTNEVYAAFQHIARGLSQFREPLSSESQKSYMENTLSEFDKAHNSHLKRLALDAHKIAINNILSEARPILDALEFVFSNMDLPKIIENGYEVYIEIKKKRAEVRLLYLKAKRAEGRGESPLAEYKKAFKSAGELEILLDDVRDSRSVLYALKRDEEIRMNQEKELQNQEEQLQLQRDHLKHNTRLAWIAIIVAILSAGITALGVFKPSCLFPDTEDTKIEVKENHVLDPE